MTAYASPRCRPAAAPCNTRPATSTPMLGAAAHTTLPTAKTARASRCDPRGPACRSIQCTAGAAATDPTKYRDVAHEKSRCPPMSETAVGSKLIVRKVLAADSASPLASNVDVPKYWRPSSARQPLPVPATGYHRMPQFTR